MSELSDEEQRVLKEFAQNLIAAGRTGRFLRLSLIWLASSIGAGWVVWEFLGLGRLFK